MWLGTKDSKENIGPISQSTSVGEILYSLAVAYPAATPFPIGASLMQATLSPQEAADLLFYLMNVMSTVSASTTTPSTARTFSSIDAGLMFAMDPAQRTRLKSAIETHISKAKPRKGWSKKVYEAKIIEIKGKLAAL
jgi:hypothetical protein